MRKAVSEKTLSWSPAPAAAGLCWAGKTRQSFSTQFVREARRTSADQTLAKQWLPIFKKHGETGRKRGGGGSLWSRVVAPAHARCVFYCSLIIVQLLLGRIYWNRQAARLLTAYEAHTSCVTGRRLIFAWPCKRRSSCTPVGGTRSSSVIN